MPDRADEGADFFGVLDPHLRLDTAGDVDAVGLELAHDLAHVTRFKTARDEHFACLEQRASGLPVPGAAGAAALVGGPGVEHDRVGPVARTIDHPVSNLQ